MLLNISSPTQQRTEVENPWYVGFRTHSLSFLLKSHYLEGMCNHSPWGLHSVPRDPPPPLMFCLSSTWLLMYVNLGVPEWLEAKWYSLTFCHLSLWASNFILLQQILMQLPFPLLVHLLNFSASEFSLWSNPETHCMLLNLSSMFLLSP